MRGWTTLSAVIVGLGFTLACGGGSDVDTENLEAPAPEIVSAHTSGTISRVDPIKVQLTADAVGDDAVGTEVQVISTVPAVSGKATWTSRREITFVPDAPLASGQEYAVAVALSQVKPEWSDFGFTVGVVPQSAWFDRKGLESEGEDGLVQRYRGAIVTADAADDAVVEQMLKASFEGKEVAIRWEHGDPREHAFVIEGLRRQEAATRLTLTLDTRPLGLEETRDDVVDLPGTATFAVTDAKVVVGAERYVELRFSDPVDPKQNLQGLISVSGKRDLAFDVKGSVVRIDSASGWSGELTVEARDVKNKRGVPLTAPFSTRLSFEPIKPGVRFVGKGVVLPTGSDVTLPVEVANLRSVVVTAYQVFDDNMGQFLQVNQLDGDRELDRVGRVVWRDRVPVEAQGANRWSRVGLDLGPLVDAHPGGMYRLELDFDRSDVVWDCPTPAPESKPVAATPTQWENADNGNSYWDDYEGDDGVPSWQLYDQRHDPCSAGYYRKYYDHDVKVGRNVLLSNLGVTAKLGEDDRLVAFATDLSTALPKAGVELQVLDYQQQVLASASTNPDGSAVFAGLDRQPFVIQAVDGTDRAWVKLDRGSANAVSHFDVGGSSVAEGLKGTFYTERGVWRPGDDIHLTFVLFDENGTLPKDHPITFELMGPQGNRVESRTVTQHVDRFYTLTTRTAQDAPTGPYTARVRVGGRTFERSLRVESIVPNRLKIELDYGTDLIEGPNAQLAGVLTSRWLHGAKAPGLNATIEMKLSPAPTTFPAYEDYAFDDPTARFVTEPVEVFSGTLDDEGKVAVDAALNIDRGAPGMLKATFVTRVFEPSGAASIDEGSVPLSPYAAYVGIKLPKGDKARGMLLTDQDHPVDIVMVDAKGKPVNGEVEVAFYKVNWRWWWESGAGDLADYMGSKSIKPIKEGRITLTNGKGSFPIQVKYPDWGRYVVVARDVNGGHKAGRTVYVDWPGWAGRAQADNPGGASVLSVTASESSVKVGDEVTLNIPTSMGGRALVSLETGTSVLQTAWVEPTGETTTYTFKATGAMAPNIYAHVTLVQPHGGKNDLPIRMYGIVPVEVVDPATKLEPVVATADVLEPESTATIEVSEKAGKPMTYTLAVVDEGLLGLTRFKTPNLWGDFYTREALGVRTWDLFSMVAGATGGALESLIAIGGGDDAGDTPPAKANRFPPVVKVLGPFRLEAGKKATHDVELPPYIGEVRVMVVAGRDGAYGSAERSVPVRKPLMLLATLPRVLGPQEELGIPVSVFALEDTIKDVTVSVTVDVPIAVEGGKQTLRFAQAGDQVVTFPAKVLDRVGIARVTVTAEGGGETATQVIEIDVRHPGSVQQKAVEQVVQGGTPWLAAVDLFGLEGTNEAVLEVSRVPPMDLERRLDELVRYPHGCVEQTTSGAFPQVYLTKLIDLPDERAHRIQSHVTAGIQRLRSFQLSDGSFGYWPGAGETNEWATTYAGHFLVEAERAGYLVPADMKQAWVGYQTQAANRWSGLGERTDLQQAYRLYSLALAGKPALGAMNRLKESRTLSTEATWRLAAAYHLAGQTDTAKQLVAGLSVASSSGTRELSGTFGSASRDEAMILDALALIEPDSSRASDMAVRVSSALTAPRWLSTQETAYGLVAMARYAQSGSGQLSFGWSLDGGPVSQVDSARPLASVPLPVKDADAQLKLEAKGQGKLYARVVTRGLPPVGQELPGSNGLAVDVSYVLAGRGSAVDPTALDQGMDLFARVTVKNTSGKLLQELALTQIFPSGWEIHGTEPGKGEGFEYRDVRDDRVFTYFDLKSGESRSFTVGLNASYKGHFYLPGVHVEAMYDAETQATSKGQWVDVALPGPRG